MISANLCFLFLLSTDDGKEETAIGAYWVTDGIDRCLVGFLPRHCIPHKEDFDGQLVQVVDLLWKSDNATERRRSHHNKGCCKAAIISSTNL